MAGPPYVDDEKWYTLAEAQELVGIEGTRGKRLRTRLRRLERQLGVILIRETRLPGGKVRREVSEWDLWDLFPEKFPEEMAEVQEVERMLFEARAANDPKCRVLRKVHGYFRSRIDSLLDRKDRSNLRPSAIMRRMPRLRGVTSAPPSAARSSDEGERRDDAEKATTEREPPSGDGSR
jgi:hypothetical protein